MIGRDDACIYRSQVAEGSEQFYSYFTIFVEDHHD